MKILFGLSILSLFPLHQGLAEDCIEGNFNEKSEYAQLKSFYVDISPVIKATIKEVVKEYKKHERPELSQNTYLIVQQENNIAPTVFGLTEKQVLAIDDDREGSACSSKHIRNDMSNRWCHAIIVKLAYQSAKQVGIPNFPAAMLGASIFVVKEYAIDLKPSKPDLVIADYEFYNSLNKKEKITGTLFGDGMVFINYEKKF